MDQNDDRMWDALFNINEGWYRDEKTGRKITRFDEAVTNLWTKSGLFGYTDQNGMVDTCCDSLCCVEGSITHKIWQVNISSRYKNYWRIAAHELRHVRAYYRRLREIVNQVNQREQPCLESSELCASEAARVKKELQQAANDAGIAEQNHQFEFPYGTPQDGMEYEWDGVYDDEWNRIHGQE